MFWSSLDNLIIYVKYLYYSLQVGWKVNFEVNQKYR